MVSFIWIYCKDKDTSWVSGSVDQYESSDPKAEHHDILASRVRGNGLSSKAQTRWKSKSGKRNDGVMWDYVIWWMVMGDGLRVNGRILSSRPLTDIAGSSCRWILAFVRMDVCRYAHRRWKGDQQLWVWGRRVLGVYRGFLYSNSSSLQCMPLLVQCWV